MEVSVGRGRGDARAPLRSFGTGIGFRERIVACGFSLFVVSYRDYQLNLWRQDRVPGVSEPGVESAWTRLDFRTEGYCDRF